MPPVRLCVFIFIATGVTAFAEQIDEVKWRQTLDAGNQALKDAQYVRARECYNTLLELASPLPAGHPLHAYSLASLGSLELLIGNEPKAELLFVQARQILEANKLQTLPQYAQILADLGIVKSNRGQWFEAEPLLLQSIAIFPAGSSGRAAVVSRLAALYSAQGRTEDALRLFDEAIAIQRQKLPEELQALLYSLEALGSSWLTQGRLDRAEMTLREAWEMSRKLPPAHPLRAETATYLGAALLRQGKPERAAPLLRTALGIYEGSHSDHPCASGPVLTTLARLDISDKHYAMAEQKLQRVVDIFGQCYPPDHIAVAFARTNLAQLYIDQRKYEEARPLMDRALPIIRVTYPGMRANLAAAVYEEARMEAGLRDFANADVHFRESISGYEKSVDPHDPGLGAMLRTYATFLKKAHRNSEAQPLEARAKSIFAFQQH